MSSDATSPPTAAPAPSRRRGPALHWQILIGLLIGGGAGLVARTFYPPAADGTPDPGLAWVVRNIAYPLGEIFLRLIFMVVLPLVFTALVLGVAELGDVRRLGRVGLRTLGYTVILSAISVGIGVGLTNAVKPGERLSAAQRETLKARYETEAARKVAQARESKTALDSLLDIVPRNLLREMVGAVDGTSPGGGMLAVMFFALLFGIALSLVPARAAPLITVLQGVYDAVMVIIGWAMRLAPLGVAGLVFRLTADLGADILRVLGWYVLTVLGGLLLHFLGVYSVFVGVASRRSPRRFFADISEATLTAFATSSSNATLPTTLRVSEERLRLRPEIGRFVLTVGATANQNGTALYEGVTVLFLAQVFGVELTLVQQITVALLAILAGVGTAGVPGGSLPLVVIVLQTVGVPADGIGIILGVDRLLDMCRTTLNVTGDLAIAACVDRAEGRQTPASPTIGGLPS